MIDVQAQSNVVQAIPLREESIVLDGLPNELIWQQAPTTGSFTQREPAEGEPGTVPIETRFVYDSEFLFVSAIIHRKAEEVQAITSRRDNSANSERIIFSFDTYLDRITSYSFGVTASAVRLDYYHPTDAPFNRDYSWNPVWEAQTHQDSAFWSVEIKIPFSQLRFNDAEELVFGMNINHYIPNTNEDSFWIHIPRNEVGWASHFGYLKGIKGVKSTHRLETMPYYATDIQHKDVVVSGNPFDARYQWQNRLGADVKVGLGTNLTLDATINPDFGQVEADPAFVNLSQFEVIQTERRPFFTEGAALFSGGGAGYFYSRRIGANPSFSPDADFISTNTNTTILAAGKVTGRLSNGLSVGALTSVTGNEFVNTFNVATTNYQQIKVEPLSSYNVLRLQQEFGEYGSRVGMIATGVKRQLEPDSELDKIMNRQAFTGAVDWNIRLNKRMYELNGNLGFSHVEGHPQAIMRLQRSSARNFQRPDASYVRLDSTRTSLSGFTGELTFAKREGNFLWSISGETESPGFELNDIGVVQSVDEYNLSASATLRDQVPRTWYNRMEFSTSIFSVWNYGHVRNGTWWSNDFEWVFPEFQRFSVFHEYQFGGLSDDITRGGPLMRRPTGNYVNVNIRSNQGAANRGGITVDYFQNAEGSWNTEIAPSFEGQLSGRWEFSVSPRLSLRNDERQYIRTQSRSDERTFGNRYIFSRVDQSTLSLRLRLNYSITPDMSLELYAEPFVSTARFSRFGELAEAKTNQIRFYGTDGTSITQTNNEYVVTDGIDTFSFSNPSFKVFSFRSNLVFRYEWIPGSTLFLVWQQNRFNQLNEFNQVRSGDILDTLTAHGTQVLALKVSYWLPGNKLFF